MEAKDRSITEKCGETDTSDKRICDHILKELPVSTLSDRGECINYGENNSAKPERRIIPWIPPPAKTTRASRFTYPSDKGNKAPLSHRSSRRCQTSPPVVQLGKVSNLHNCKESEKEWARPAVSSDGELDKVPATNKLPIQPRCRRITENLAKDVRNEEAWNWSIMRQWVREIDQSVDVLSESIRGLLNSNPQDKLDQERALLDQAESIKRATSEVTKTDFPRLLPDCNGRFYDYDEQKVMMGAEQRVETQLMQAELNKTKIELEQAKAERDAQEAEMRRLLTVQNSLEALKGHLQLQLRHKSAECERLTSQLRQMETKRFDGLKELSDKLEAAMATIDKLRREREIIKRAAKGQKKRAQKAEARLGEVETEINTLRTRFNEPVNDKKFAGDEEDARDNSEDLGEPSLARPTEADKQEESKHSTVSPAMVGDVVTRLEEENRRLRELASSYENRLAVAEREINNLQVNISQTEDRLSEYRNESMEQWRRMQKEVWTGVMSGPFVV
uniref:Intracellular protein transport protein USO1 n=1 Tax=Mesocestoides corti TaxID=53468 RepID=A0A5K3FJ72_MESCO